MNQTQFLMRR